MIRAWLFAAIFLCVSGFITDPAAASQRGDLQVCTRSRNNAAVIAACTRALDSGIDDQRARLEALEQRCQAYKLTFDYTHAAADCRTAVETDPGNASVWNLLGGSDYALGRFDQALADFAAMIRINPKAEPAFYNRTLVWLDKHDLDRAMADINEAIRLAPSNANSFHVRAQIWQEMGDYDRAFADASRAVAMAPRDGRIRARRGEIWRLKGDLVHALQDQDAAVRLAPRLTVTWRWRADTYRYAGQYDRALADYDRALRLSPDYIAAYAGKGLTYEKLGDTARARTEFEKAVASPAQMRSDVNLSGLETARAHLAALDSGASLPVIAPAPERVASSTSIPTPQVTVPAQLTLPAAAHGRRVALVLGNSAYSKVPALPNPQRDASAIAASLRAIGFDVVLETNDTREKMVGALRSFATLAEGAEWAMVYYAGHGIEMGGVNYLIPIDAQLATDRDVQFEAIPFDQVMASLEGAKKLKLVLLDACRDNPFVPQMRRTPGPQAAAASTTAGAAIATRSIGRGLGEVKVSGATLVVYAAKQGEVALDGDGGNSPFAVAFAQRLATPGVEINKVFRLVRDDVMEATAGRQEPYTYGSLPGSEDFFFVER